MPRSISGWQTAPALSVYFLETFAPLWLSENCSVTGRDEVSVIVAAASCSAWHRNGFERSALVAAKKRGYVVRKALELSSQPCLDHLGQADAVGNLRVNDGR